MNLPDSSHELAQLRAALALSQAELAAHCGVSRAYIGQCETDETHFTKRLPHITPTLRTLLATHEEASGDDTKSIVAPQPSGRVLLPVMFPGGERIYNDERAVFIGVPGSGKSTFATTLLRPMNTQAVVVLDAKPSPSLATLLPDFTITNRYQPEASQQIIRAPHTLAGNATKTKQFWDAQCAAIHRRGACTVFVDDLLPLCPHRTLPDGLRLLLTSGRELGIGVWIAVQTPRNIPGEVLDYAEHLFLFAVRNEEHRKFLAERINERVDDDIEPDIPREKRMLLYINYETGYVHREDLDRERREAQRQSAKRSVLTGTSNRPSKANKRRARYNRLCRCARRVPGRHRRRDWHRWRGGLQTRSRAPSIIINGTRPMDCTPCSRRSATYRAVHRAGNDHAATRKVRPSLAVP